MVATRWGICSAGKIAHDFLAALKTLPPEDHQVVAIASRDLSRAEEYAKTHGIPKAYGSYAELAEDPDVAIGDVMVLHAEFGSPQLSIPRCVEKELGGGGLLDIGCYCIQFACMVFNGEKPESILASGFLHNTGVDKTVSIILNYSRHRQAVLTCTMTAKMPNRASINGTKGMIEIPSTFWCPTELVVNGQRESFPLPPSPMPVHFSNSIGLRYEAEHVRQCLLQGLKESPVLTHADSALINSILDEIRRQVGVLYAQDDMEHIPNSFV
nr:trans-1,2-dihydrobenzene-1,2-diol dehydrogenase-like [Pogona vitticeps]